MAGNVDADEQARRFSYVQRQASSNYCISGKKIVCCVPEEYRRHPPVSENGLPDHRGSRKNPIYYGME